MINKSDSISEAKRSLKSNILFLQELLEHLKGVSLLPKQRAYWAAWCIHRYFNDRLIADIEDAVKKNAPSIPTS